MMLTGLLHGCERKEPSRGEFASSEEGQPLPASVIQSRTGVDNHGWPGLEIHLMVPPTGTEDAVRVTLQQTIDSLVGADSSLLRVRATAFMMGQVDTTFGQAQVVPVMTADWGPTDPETVDQLGRRARFLTQFVLHREVPLAGVRDTLP